MSKRQHPLNMILDSYFQTLPPLMPFRDMDGEECLNFWQWYNNIRRTYPQPREKRLLAMFNLMQLRKK